MSIKAFQICLLEEKNFAAHELKVKQTQYFRILIVLEVNINGLISRIKNHSSTI